MRSWKTYIAAAAILNIVVILGGIFAKPVWAQVRATLVRDIDNPALTPFRASVDYDLSYLNDQRLLTTVPAGKRLVIDYISYWSAGAAGDNLVWAGLRVGALGPMRAVLEIHPPHPSADAAFTIQDGSQPVKLYFEAGEQVWVSVSHNTAGHRSMELLASGYLITP